jgi:hypothetical protein
VSWLIGAAAGGAWLAASRFLFRRWWRNDSLTGLRRCPNSAHWSYYRKQEMTHSGQCCLGRAREPRPLPAIAGLAMLAGLVWPVFVLAGLVIWRRPVPHGETQARIAELEKMLEADR